MNVLILIIILGVSALLVVFGLAYDYFFRKSFTEVKRVRSAANQSAERAKLDIATNITVNSTNLS